MTDKDNCPCGSGLQYSNCCEPVIRNINKPQTAEQLMRSRYSAYARSEIEYLINTVPTDKRHLYDSEGIQQWADNSQWEKLEIINTKNGGINDSYGTVEFVAHYYEQGTKKTHHELSYFKKENEIWYFDHAEYPQSTSIKSKTGRNEPCPCGSGKKYKKCCGK